MHISDWDDSFFSKLEPRDYVASLKHASTRSIVLFAQSHTGLCYYPTKSGQMHRGLHNRDFLGETIALCHRAGIDVVVYYSVIFNDWAYKNFPQWRILTADGTGAAENSRYGVCCPNSPYRDFAFNQVGEICTGYDFEGIRFDMTFWPGVCYCDYCQSKFSELYHRELPRIVDWSDPVWVAFQRQRESWLLDFAHSLTTKARELKPDISIEHQSSTFTLTWNLGVVSELATENDFLQGDFYGDALQASFVCKLFHSLTPNRPFAFETSTSLNLGDHTTLKSKHLLRAKAYSAYAHAGAFVFIDAINPSGTLNQNVYRMMGEIFNEIEKYEPYLGGELCQDVAIYLSTESKFDPAASGADVMDAQKQIMNLSERMPHIEAALGAAQSLIHAHIPFGIITRKNLHELSKFKVLVLPNVLMMNETEVDAIRKFVADGGSLYASKATSLITKAGIKQENFMLSDVLGVSYRSETTEELTYIAPLKFDSALFLNYSAEYPLCIHGSRLRIEAHQTASVLGVLVLPYTDPKEPRKYASIHSNPPGKLTDSPALVLNRFGKGTAIYVAGDPERTGCHEQIFVNLVNLLSPHAFAFESDAPKSVEVTLFHQPEEQRYIINLLNFQKELPNIPVHNVTVKLNLDGAKPVRIFSPAHKTEVKFQSHAGKIEFIVTEIETYEMFVLEYVPVT